jgi:hypothetical protein
MNEQRTRTTNGGCLTLIIAVITGRYVCYWVFGVWPNWWESLLLGLGGSTINTIWLFLGIAHCIPGAHWPLVR